MRPLLQFLRKKFKLKFYVIKMAKYCTEGRLHAGSGWLYQNRNRPGNEVVPEISPVVSFDQLQGAHATLSWSKYTTITQAE
jgi:hypothetical protein